MKLPTLIALISFTLLITAQAEVMDLITTSGRTYRNCRVVKVEPDGVSFRHDHGAGKVLFKDLTSKLREHFGYDQIKADAHEAKVRADRAKARAEAMKKANDEAKAAADALERFQEQQTMHALRKALTQLATPAQAEQWLPVRGSAVIMGPTFNTSSYVQQPAWCGAWSHPLGRNMYGCYPPVVTPQVCNTSGYRPVPFFAVPGIGPNVVTPSAQVRVTISR
jgi:hypothetical protein